MGWSHPGISLRDMMTLIKGFVDMLILSSGYQSSGMLAYWDAENIKKAIRWGRFFEDVFRQLRDLDGYQDSIKELDAALLELRTNCCFPQGLAHLSCATLCRGREFILRHLLQTLPLRDDHLSTILTATIEVDLDDLSNTEHDIYNIYIDKLLQHLSSLNLVEGTKTFVKDSLMLSPRVDFFSEHRLSRGKLSNISSAGGVESAIARSPMSKDCIGGDLSRFVVQDILRRRNAISCISSIEKGLEALLEIYSKEEVPSSNISACKGHSLNTTSISPMMEDKRMEFLLWNKWKTRGLSYLLDKRTIRLLSGAKLIFSAPKVQWARVFDSLKGSSEAHKSDFIDIIELLLLGLVSGRWSDVIKHVNIFSYYPHPISKQYFDVCDGIRERSQNLLPEDQKLNPKETEIFEYLMTFMGIQGHMLWKFPPVLMAAAIPSSSSLLGLYLSQIEKMLRGDSSNIRCCSCNEEGSEHRECEVAERICWLYIFRSGDA